ncbi:MAG: PAS domain S-box protein [Elusimicrobia bacterium]|nr:PAS domain S-box protein [Elusimicrobiota bacterium]
MKKWIKLLFYLAITAFLFSLFRNNLLLFHASTGFLSVVIAAGIFMITWHSRKILNNGFIIFLGVGYLFIGIVDFLQILSYPEIGVLYSIDMNTTIQLWTAGRYLEAGTFIAGIFFVNKNNIYYYQMPVYALVTFLLLFSIIHLGIFPACYIAGAGATMFKLVNNGIIILLFMIAGYLIYINRSTMGGKAMILLECAIAASIISELMFVRYTHIAYMFHTCGHLVKLTSYYFLYLAISNVRQKFSGEDLYLSLIMKNMETSRKKEEILKQKEFTDNILNTAQTIVLVLDIDASIVYFNRYMQDISGYRLEDVRGCDWFSTFLPQEEAGIIKKVFRETVRDMDTRGTVNSIITRSGRKLDIEWYNKTLKDDRGNVYGVLSIGYDVTEKLKNEKERRDYEKKLAYLEKLSSLGKLAGGVAHEINNPLTSILSTAELLEDEIGEDSRIKQDIEQIISESKRIKDIVKSFLGYARSREYIFRDADINDIVEDVLSVIGRGKLDKYEVVKDYSRDLEKISISKFHMEEVLINMISNALESMEDGGKLTLSTGRKDAEWVYISIRDTGVGIGKKDIDKIFEPYYTTKKVMGTGLGLSTCAVIIARHEGTIEVKCEGEGKGAEFIIYLPNKRS